MNPQSTTDNVGSIDKDTFTEEGDLFLTVPLDALVPDNAGLRTEVNKKREDWPGFVQSIKDDGIQQSIFVRPHPHKTGSYIIINGFHRFEAALEALTLTNNERKAENLPPLSTSDILVPVIVRNVTDTMEILKYQLSLNAHTISTRPIEYSEQIQRIMKASDFRITLEEIATLLNMSTSWVSNMLKLRQLTPKAKELVETGNIKAAVAFHLARLPKEEQEYFHDRAERMNAQDFASTINNRLAELRVANRQSRGDASTFRPTAKIITKAEGIKLVESYYEQNLSSIPDAQIEGTNKSALEYQLGYYDGMRRFLSLDDESIALQEEDFRAERSARLRKQQEKELAKNIETTASRGVSVFGKNTTTEPII